MMLDIFLFLPGFQPMLPHTGMFEGHQGLVFSELGMQHQLGVSPQNNQPAQNNKFGCHLCGKKFQWKALLDRHMMIHTGEKPYKCHVCGQAFNRTSNRNTHMRTLHLQEYQQLSTKAHEHI